MTPASASVLVVEDDADIRALVVRLLIERGHAATGSADPHEALELARTRPFDLVISDITMPLLDGYALLRLLQQDPATASLPVLFLTARREFGDRVRAFRFGVVDYITKPFTRDGLLARVERALAQVREPGTARGQGAGAAAALLAEARQTSRSGVLSVASDGSITRALVQAGEIVASTGPLPEVGSAEFRELDPRREQILAATSSRALSSDVEARLPDFEDLPPALRTALLVDDDAEFRRFLRDVFEARGFVIHEAGDGEQGLALALEQRPWLILTDVTMPGIDGIELCRRVRLHSLIRHTPLVFVSGFDDYRERYRGLQAGGDEFVSKLSPVRELLIRVQIILRRYAEMGRGASLAALAGEIEVVGAPGVLQMCHLGRLTGTLGVDGPPGRFEARFRRGEIVAAQLGPVEGTEAVWTFLGWASGRFAFRAGQAGAGAPLGESFDQILLEGCRRLDEAGRGAS
jgi:DNA-binding response OmpR family regulator